MSYTEQIPLSHDHTMVHQDTWGEIFSVNDDAGAPQDLTGYIVRAVVKKTAAAADPVLLEASNAPGGSGITIGGAGNNQITIKKDMTVAPGSYVRDVVLISLTNYRRTYIRGAFVVI